MKVLIRVCIILLMLLGFRVAYAENANTASGTTYIVKHGDTLDAIAKKFPGTTWQRLAAANNIANPNLIYPNTALRINTAKTAAAAVDHPSRKRANVVTQAQPHKVIVPSRNAAAIMSGGEECDTLRTLRAHRQLPDAVRTMFENSAPLRDGKAFFTQDYPHAVVYEDKEYLFEVSPHCISTLRTRTHRNTAPPLTDERNPDHGANARATAQCGLPPPENAPGYITTLPLREIDPSMTALQKTEYLKEGRTQIRAFFKKYMDPALPLDCMENVLLEKLYPVAQNPSPTGSLPQSERPSQQE